MNSERTAKLTGIALSISAIILAFSPPATEYEVSLYPYTPAVLWITLAISLVLTVSTIIKSDRFSHLLGSAGLVLLFYTILFSIPIARGYHLYGRGNSDILTHIGYAKAVNQTLSWYPAIHIQMRFLQEWGFSWEFVATILAIVFSFLFAFGVALYARSLLNDKQAWVITLAATVIPFLGPFTRLNHPAVYSFMLLPLGLWLARKGKQVGERRYIASALLVSSAIIIFHPVTVIILLVGLVIDDIPTAKKTGTSISVFVGVLAVSWYMGFNRFATIVAVVAIPNIGGAATSSTTALFDPALTPLDIAIQGIRMYGTIAIIGILGGFATVVLLWDNLRGNGEPSDSVLIGHYLASGVFGGSFLFIDLVVSAPIRAARYGVFASLLMLPNVTRPLSGQRRLIARGMVMILLTVALALSIGTVYDSNKHFTETEYEGAKWQSTYHSGSKPVYARDMGKKLDFYLFGAATDRFVFASQPIPDRLGYANSETVGRSVDEGYIVTKSYDLRFVNVFVPEKRSRRMVYSQEDVERLANDPTANSVYTNGGYSVWLV